MEEVIVFNHGTPRQRLLAWFIADNGVPVKAADTLDEVVAACARRAVRVVVVNSEASRDEVRDLIAKLRDHCSHAVLFYVESGLVSTPLDPFVRSFSITEPDALVGAIRHILER
jgi:hypothetical protein